MNQEFLTLLHLVDAKIGYTSGLPGSYLDGSTSQLDDFLKPIIQNQAAGEIIKEGIVDYLCFVIDYKGDVVPFLERKKINAPNPIFPKRPLNIEYIKTRSDMVSTYDNKVSNLHKEVPGIIVSAQLNVMRTEGVFVEALLGQGDALDAYSHGLQDEAVREKQLKNDLKEKEIAKMELANSVIDNDETSKAKLFEQIYPCCPDNILGCTDSQNMEKKDVGNK